MDKMLTNAIKRSRQVSLFTYVSPFPGNFSLGDRRYPQLAVHPCRFLGALKSAIYNQHRQVHVNACIRRPHRCIQSARLVHCAVTLLPGGEEPISVAGGQAQRLLIGRQRPRVKFLFEETVNDHFSCLACVKKSLDDPEFTSVRKSRTRLKTLLFHIATSLGTESWRRSRGLASSARGSACGLPEPRPCVPSPLRVQKRRAVIRRRIWSPSCTSRSGRETTRWRAVVLKSSHHPIRSPVGVHECISASTLRPVYTVGVSPRN